MYMYINIIIIVNITSVVCGSRNKLGGVFECDSGHRRSVAVLCACIITGETRRTHFIVLYLFRMYLCRLHAVLWLHIGILMLSASLCKEDATYGILMLVCSLRPRCITSQYTAGPPLSVSEKRSY